MNDGAADEPNGIIKSLLNIPILKLNKWNVTHGAKISFHWEVG
jgi:hypothetical protein